MAHISIKKHGARWFASRIDSDDRITWWTDSTRDALSVSRKHALAIAYTYNRVVAKNGGGKFAKIVSSQTKESAQ